jgi:hypothetical protein
VTKDGLWYCLEVDPMPTFLPYEMAAGQSIGSAVLDALLAPPRYEREKRKYQSHRQQNFFMVFLPEIARSGEGKGKTKFGPFATQTPKPPFCRRK